MPEPAWKGLAPHPAWPFPKVAYYTAEQMREIAQAADKAATERVIAEIWQMLDGMIVRGPLQGNGWDETAQRNGVILAANAVAAIRALKGNP